MSETPTPGSGELRDDTLAYHVPAAKTSGLALTSMVMGIASIPLLCALGLGIPLGLVALVLGIVARVQISRTPDRFGGKGFAVAGTWTGVISVLLGPLFLVILLPSGGKPRELSNRSVCAANLRGIMQSMSVYAADNAGAYPVVSPVGGYGLAAAGTGTPGVDADATIASMYKVAATPSVTQNMWLLVLNGQVAPKQFLCKSDPANVDYANATFGTNYQTNFNVGKGAPSDFAYSYSFAYPWTAAGKIQVGGWWKDASDAGLPLIADMAPLAGSGKPAATPGDGRSKSANSFNHQQDGQNIGFGDSHAEFSRTANVGHKDDNIYAGSRGTPSPLGTQTAGIVPDIGTGGTAGAYDVCLVPAADASAGYKRK